MEAADLRSLPSDNARNVCYYDNQGWPTCCSLGRVVIMLLFPRENTK